MYYNTTEKHNRDYNIIIRSVAKIAQRQCCIRDYRILIKTSIRKSDIFIIVNRKTKREGSGGGCSKRLNVVASSHHFHVHGLHFTNNLVPIHFAHAYLTWVKTQPNRCVYECICVRWDYKSSIATSHKIHYYDFWVLNLGSNGINFVRYVGWLVRMSFMWTYQLFVLTMTCVLSVVGYL